MPNQTHAKTKHKNSAEVYLVLVHRAYPWERSIHCRCRTWFGDLSLEILMARMWLNKCTQIDYQQTAITQPSPKNRSALTSNLSGNNPFLNRGAVGYATIKTAGLTTLEDQELVASILWVTNALVVSSLLLFCGLIGVLFMYRTSTPDILGFASTTTMDNPDFEPLKEEYIVDVLKRIARLARIRVRTADLKSGEESRHATLVPVVVRRGTSSTQHAHDLVTCSAARNAYSELSISQYLSYLSSSLLSRMSCVLPWSTTSLLVSSAIPIVGCVGGFD